MSGPVATLCKGAGSILLAIGLVALVFCTVRVISEVRTPEFRRARLAQRRNPDNVMYQAEFARQVTPVVLSAGIGVAGLLLAVNGVTLFLLGGVIVRQRKSEGASAKRFAGRAQTRPG